MCRRYLLFLFLFFLSFAGNATAQILVSASQSAQALAQKLVGSGVIIQNPQLTCPTEANGIFKVVSSNLGLDSGIVLTTGRAATTGNKYGVNGNAFSLASNSDGAPGDPMLDALAGQPTHDACSLEMDVIPNGDTIKFDYVFSSEEYINATCGPYNDAFAFFISGPGINGQENMALVPGTNIPVTINSINSGVPGPGNSLTNCTDMGPGSPFTSYFINNGNGTTLTHQGLTSVLKAFHAVTPCTTYHLKITIADGGNSLYDSGVFLKAGSLQTSSFTIIAEGNIPPGETDPYAVKGCLPARFLVKASQVKTTAQTVKFLIGGTAVSGIDYTPPSADSIVIPANDTAAELIINALPTMSNIPKSLTVLVEPAFNCNGMISIVDSATIVLYDTASISILTPDTTICAGDKLQLIVENGYDFLSYTWSPAAGLNSPSIEDPIATPYANTLYTVKATIPGGSCPPQTAAVMLTVKPQPYLDVVPQATVCIDKPFQLKAFVGADTLDDTYLWTGPGGFVSAVMDPVIPVSYSYAQGTYIVTVTSKLNGCKNVDSIYLSVYSPDTPIVISPLIICKDKTAMALSAEGNSLVWYAAATDINGTATPPVPASGDLGSYYYYVTQQIGQCESAKSSINVIVEKCCDGIFFIPDAFTPNADGKNDRFEVKKDYGYKVTRFNVYNRWGQTVFAGYDTDSWDGTFGGKPVDIGTYFYDIVIDCINGGQIKRRGEVMVIR